MTLPAAVQPRSPGLTPKQERLVELVLSTGEKPHALAERAGYRSGSAACKAWRTDAVQERYRELVHEHMSLDVASALQTRRALLDSRSDYVRLEAAKDVLDRAGFKPVERHLVGVQGTLNVSIDLS